MLKIWKWTKTPPDPFPGKNQGHGKMQKKRKQIQKKKKQKWSKTSKIKKKRKNEKHKKKFKDCLVRCSLISSFFVPFFGWCCVPSLFCWVGAAFLSSPFGGVAVFSFSFWLYCLPSPPLVELHFSPLLLGGAAWFPLSLGGVAFLSLPLGSDAFLVVLLSFPSFGKWRFSPLFGWVVLLGLLWAALLFQSPSMWCCLPSPSFGGAAFLLSSVGWCCLVSFFFGWCCCFQS